MLAPSIVHSTWAAGHPTDGYRARLSFHPQEESRQCQQFATSIGTAPLESLSSTSLFNGLASNGSWEVHGQDRPEVRHLHSYYNPTGTGLGEDKSGIVRRGGSLGSPQDPKGHVWQQSIGLVSGPLEPRNPVVCQRSSQRCLCRVFSCVSQWLGRKRLCAVLFADDTAPPILLVLKRSSVHTTA